jgi:hypothetical protein
LQHLRATTQSQSVNQCQLFAGVQIADQGDNLGPIMAKGQGVSSSALLQLLGQLQIHGDDRSKWRIQKEIPADIVGNTLKLLNILDSYDYTNSIINHFKQHATKLNIEYMDGYAHGLSDLPEGARYMSARINQVDYRLVFYVDPKNQMISDIHLTKQHYAKTF